jgi:hypothetical protein
MKGPCRNEISISSPCSAKPAGHCKRHPFKDKSRTTASLEHPPTQHSTFAAICARRYSRRPIIASGWMMVSIQEPLNSYPARLDAAVARPTSPRAVQTMRAPLTGKPANLTGTLSPMPSSMLVRTAMPVLETLTAKEELVPMRGRPMPTGGSCLGSRRRTCNANSTTSDRFARPRRICLRRDRPGFVPLPHLSRPSASPTECAFPRRPQLFGERCASLGWNGGVTGNPSKAPKANRRRSIATGHAP